MANTTPKKADTVAAKDVKETKPVVAAKPMETKAPEVKAEKAVKPAAAPKAEKKPAAKKPAAKKAAPKKAAAAKAPKAEKKAAATKVILEYRGKQVNQDDIVAAVKADWKGAAIKTLEIYVKPEDAAAYYVVNGKESGKVTL